MVTGRHGPAGHRFCHRVAMAQRAASERAGGSGGGSGRTRREARLGRALGAGTTAPHAVVLVLPGGVAHSERRRSPAATAVAVSLARRLAHTAREETLVAHIVHYRYRGWNGEAAHPAQDAEWALNEVVRRYGDVSICLAGMDIGARAALRVAGHPAVASVLAIAPRLPEAGTETDAYAGAYTSTGAAQGSEPGARAECSQARTPRLETAETPKGRASKTWLSKLRGPRERHPELADTAPHGEGRTRPSTAPSAPPESAEPSEPPVPAAAGAPSEPGGSSEPGAPSDMAESAAPSERLEPPRHSVPSAPAAAQTPEPWESPPSPRSSEPVEQLVGRHVLFVHGTDDTTTDPELSYQLAERAKSLNGDVCRFEVHTDGHTLLQHHSEVAALAGDFVLGTLCGQDFSRPVTDALAAPPPLGLRMPLASGFGRSLRG